MCDSPEGHVDGRSDEGANREERDDEGAFGSPASMRMDGGAMDEGDAPADSYGGDQIHGLQTLHARWKSIIDALKTDRAGGLREILKAMDLDPDDLKTVSHVIIREAYGRLQRESSVVLAELRMHLGDGRDVTSSSCAERRTWNEYNRWMNKGCMGLLRLRMSYEGIESVIPRIMGEGAGQEREEGGMSIDRRGAMLHSTKDTLERTSTRIISTLSPTPGWVHQLVLFVLEELRMHGLQRVGKACYKQIHTHDGNHPTMHWVYECNLMEFIYRIMRRDHHFAMWKEFTGHRRADTLIADKIECGLFDSYRNVVPDRYLFSFEDGIYDIRHQRFFKYGPDVVEIRKLQGEGTQNALRSTVRYFPGACFGDGAHPGLVLEGGDDGEFDFSVLAHDWLDIIPTPKWDSIFEQQGFRYDGEFQGAFVAIPSIICCYALIGRLLYTLHEIDHWQVEPFVFGVGGSGKSTIASFMRLLYKAEDIGTLSSNGETKFALGAIYDKLLYMCTEVRTGFALPQAEWQSMVTGENVQVALKGRTAFSVRWTTPGIMFGNETAGYKDTKGSTRRRQVWVPFPHPIPPERCNPNLLKEIEEEELPRVLMKINLCYRYVAAYLKDHRSRCSLHDILPASMRAPPSDKLCPVRHFVMGSMRAADSGEKVCVRDLWNAFENSQPKGSRKRKRLAYDDFKYLLDIRNREAAPSGMGGKFPTEKLNGIVEYYVAQYDDGRYE